MNNLFAYGTLMCEEIMREVSGFSLSSKPGTLKGYTRRSVKFEKYPAVTTDGMSSVEGLVYLDLPDPAWERLDRFEGDMYERRTVRIVLKDGGTLSSFVYVVKPELLDRLEQSDWDFAEFLLTGKEDFRRSYKGYRAL
jgi:gamma-glutamylcyclotransferase (GGCT)/AIG2-like uncharacterized protein YtfP